MKAFQIFLSYLFQKLQRKMDRFIVLFVCFVIVTFLVTAPGVDAQWGWGFPGMGFPGAGFGRFGRFGGFGMGIGPGFGMMGPMGMMGMGPMGMGFRSGFGFRGFGSPFGFGFGRGFFR